MGFKNKKLHQTRWMSYEAAKVTIQAVGGINSRQQYINWHKEVNPIGMPRYPWRVMPDWVSWNDFLNNTNTWEKFQKGSYRPYWETAKWARKQGVKSYAKWLKLDWENIPSDIPKAPHVIYEEWTGWSDFLGNRLEQKIETLKDELVILAVCNDTLLPANQIEFMFARDGFAKLKEDLIARETVRAVKLFIWEEEQQTTFDHIVQQLAYKQPDQTWVVTNIDGLLFELSSILDFYIIPQ